MKTYPLLTAETSPVTLILANGDYPTHPLPVALLAKCGYVVCCDGAADQFIRTGHTPNAIVGDGDSLSAENRICFSHLIQPVEEQETNDQTKAVSFCIAQNRTDLMILGATGKREDHTLGNISLLADYMDYATVSMITDYGVFTPICGDSHFESFAGQQISIFSIEPKEITTEKLLYPIHKRILTNWWQGTLNEATSDSFVIRTSGKAIIFRAFPPPHNHNMTIPSDKT